MNSWKIPARSWQAGRDAAADPDGDDDRLEVETFLNDAPSGDAWGGRPDGQTVRLTRSTGPSGDNVLWRVAVDALSWDNRDEPDESWVEAFMTMDVESTDADGTPVVRSMVRETHTRLVLRSVTPIDWNADEKINRESLVYTTYEIESESDFHDEQSSVILHPNETAGP
ncbi:MAG: hypothetical protein KDK91_10510 [Gammaproteobacteria bacterium]|nr:hypothetical protein [Gammaproteobacteria bacterium]